MECNVNCIYFPKHLYNSVEFELDENGVKRSKRTETPCCLYDCSPIENWDKCHRDKPLIK